MQLGRERRKMMGVTAFLLIHGAGHDGWSWHRVADRLVEAGHVVVAPDLPCGDTDRTLAEDVELAASSVAGSGGDVVVAGHSLGALTATWAAARLDAARLVLVAGIVGRPGSSLADLAEADADRDAPLDDGDYESDELGRFRFTEAGARRALYHDCASDAVDEACRHLRFQRSLWNEPLAIDGWPSAAVDSIVCRDDRIVRPDWSRRVARERLGVEPIELDGGHTPMLSRPDEVAAILLGR